MTSVTFHEPTITQGKKGIISVVKVEGKISGFVHRLKSQTGVPCYQYCPKGSSIKGEVFTSFPALKHSLVSDD